MIKLIVLISSLFLFSCGVKNDVIPPEEPWVIFAPSEKASDKLKKKKFQKKLQNKDSKNVNK